MMTSYPLLQHVYQAQQLRPYQQEAVSDVCAAWNKGDPSPMIAMATGGGKTTVIAQILRKTVDPEKHRALVVAHTNEIAEQLYERIFNQYDGCLDAHFGPYSRPGIGLVKGGENRADARIVVATRQSLHARRLNEVLKYGHFDTLVIDEAHHAVISNTYGAIKKRLLQANPDLKTLGATATPERADSLPLNSLFTSILCNWSITTGIESGYLVPVQRIKSKTNVILSGVANVSGDYNRQKLTSVLEAANWLDLTMEAFKTHIADANRPCLAFFPSIEMSKTFTARLNAEGIAAAHVDGNTPKDSRRQILKDYTAGKIKVVCNMGVLSEGFDAPITSAILLARPTRSRVLFSQIIGRGVRLYPGKTDCLLLDMTVNDTRTIERGSLMGKMFTCPECKTEYYAGLPGCPACGHIPEKKAGAPREPGTQAERLKGEGIVTSFSSIFDLTFGAWYHGNDGYFSCIASFDDGALIITPFEERYLLYHIPKDTKKRVRLLRENTDLASLMLSTDDHIKKNSYAGKEAAWRMATPSEAQLNLIKNLGLAVPATISKGEASQLITHTISVQRLLKETSHVKAS